MFSIHYRRDDTLYQILEGKHLIIVVEVLIQLIPLNYFSKPNDDH